MPKTYCGKDFNTFVEETGEIGFVETVRHPILHVTGLPGAVSREVVVFESGQLGRVLSLSEDYVEILSLSSDFISVGTRVARTSDLLKVPVGDGLLGFVIDPLGHSVYASKPLVDFSERRCLDMPALDIDARNKVHEPFETGVTVVDMMVPLGKGQRELVIGDRQTGKTKFLLQVMLAQAKKGTVCIYAGIGKRKADIKMVEEFFVKQDVIDKMLLVITSSLDPLGLIYLTPYTAMTIAEYFRDKGRDVVLVLDNLTSHAKAYREISLLGNRFPGRSSYPGDIFYVHSRLLERAGKFVTDKGSPSITCLPVAETIEGDISGYIPTNLMSITDGHIFFDKGLYLEGRRPAVNYFLSVTRVGRQTQSKLRWSINRELTTLLTLLEKTQRFVHFGAELSEGIRTTLKTGNKILAFFNQPMQYVVPINLQIVMFSLIWLGLLKDAENEAAMEYVILSAQSKYSSDEEFRTLIDNLVADVEDYNALLGKITPKAQNILDKLNLTQDDNKAESKK